MKNVRKMLATILLLTCSLTASAQPMSYYAMRENARFLTDRMAYTLGLTSAMIIDDLYRINYDYICGVNDYIDDVACGYRYNDYMAVVYERDRALQVLLGDRIWRTLMGYDYFYRPIVFNNNHWRFSIYSYDSRPGHFYYAPPRYYNDYRGGHFFAGMPPAPRPSTPVRPAPRPGNGSPGFHIGNTPRPEAGRPANGGNGSRPEAGRPANGGNGSRPEAGRPTNNGNNSRPGNAQTSRTSQGNGRSTTNVRSSSRAGTSSRGTANTTRTESRSGRR